MDDREFRRALLYGINREAILKDEILGGLATSLDRVISGPFPAGESDSDPLAYAYNSSVPEAKYDPRLAKILVLLAQAKLTLKASKTKEEAPPLPVIRLGVPNYESARVAGQAILQAWKVIGLDGKLVPYDKMPAIDDQSIDVLYVSASVWEPVSDAQRLFGVGGAAQSENQYIVQALEALNSARSWKEVRQGCLDLHALVAAHLPILPLWQVTETMAYRTELAGVAKKPLNLYQDVQRWRIQAR
jgi:ABC-type transport system substrate-binding protein